MPYGLKDIELAKLNEVFAANERIERVVLYGSRAKGNYKPFSDVDITLEGDELTHTDLSRLSLAIDDLLLPYQFDISIFHTLKNEALIDHIRRMGITIYEKKSEWKEYKLGEIADVIGGGTPNTSNPNYWEGGIPWLTPKDLTGYSRIYISKGERNITKEGLDNSSTKLLPKGTVLMSSRAPIGYVAIASNQICTNQGFKSLICNPLIADNLFMYYWVKNNVEYLQSLGTGTTFAEISGSVVKSIDILLPPLPTQRRIAAILSSLDDKIDLLHRENATLEQMAEMLFRQWFVEEAKEEWKEGKLGDILTVKGGTTPSTKEPSFWDGDIAWTSPRDVTTLNGLYLFKTEKKITQKGLEQISSGLLPSGTLLMSSRAPVGVLAFAEIPLAINQGYIAILDDKGYSKEFIYLWLKLNMDLVHSYSNGSTFMEISKSAFKSLDIVIPSKNEVESFVQEVKPYFEKIRTNEIQIRTLTKTRDGLLPKLMSNEINI